MTTGCVHILTWAREVDAGCGIFKRDACDEHIARCGVHARTRSRRPGKAITFYIQADSGTGNGLERYAHCQWKGVAGDDLQPVVVLGCKIPQNMLRSLAANKHGAHQQRHDLFYADSSPTRAAVLLVHQKS